MKQVRRGVYALLMVLSLLVVFPGMASAASPYDDAISLTDSASVVSPNGTIVQDISASWLSLIQSESNSNCTSIYSEISALDYENGAMLGVSTFRNSGSQRGVYVYWTTSGGLLGFHASGSFHSLVGGSNANITAGSPGTGDSGSAYFLIDDSADFTVACFPSSFSLSGNEVSDSSTDGTKIFFTSWPISYPSGYEGELVPTEPPAAKYVGMGDSFSGAEGNPSFEAGTDENGINECHRSPVAYPRLLQTSLELGPMAFVACGGATTTNILGGQWNESPQLDALSDETEVVTVTIGGNDVGVGDYILGCVVACGPGTPIYNAMMDGINQLAFKENLVFTFEEILDEAPNADLYVADYPHMADEDATTCQGLDFSGAYDVQEALNGVIDDAVVEVGLSSNRIFIVKANYPGSPFEGGHLCNGGDSLFNGLVPPPNMEYSLHPNGAGHEAYADVFEEAMS